jgi:hypothetical protein
MRVLTKFSGILLCVGLATPILAQNPPAAPAKPTGKYLKVDRFIAELDTNKDGCISHDEWVGAGLDEFNYKMLEQQAAKRDCVTATELLKGPPPDGMDSNGDGYLTVAKMLAYSKAHPMPKGGPGGPGGAGGSGGPPPADAAPDKK